MFDRLAGPEGLTAQASTFAREDVITALGAGLIGATRQELEALADRFLGERAVSVVADRAFEERRWTTPELLGVEERLVAAAVGRTGERPGLVAPEAVREALAAHPSLGADQAGMVRDACLDGAGVRVVVGRPGTGKTYTLGVARHAWQLGGYRRARRGADRDRHREPGGRGVRGGGHRRPAARSTLTRTRHDAARDRPLLDARTVLVVDEAGMVGSRKLTRLLEHAQRAQAKVVLVGDDRQLAAIDAGGGFRALRLRLGRQRARRRTAGSCTPGSARPSSWSARARWTRPSSCTGRTTGWSRPSPSRSWPWPCSTTGGTPTARPSATPPRTWWSWRPGGTRWTGSTPTASRSWPRHGRLGAERLRVEDREVAVGDRVVCGHNAIGQLGIANGSRGVVTALDAKARTLTLRLDGPDGREVTLPRWYLDGRRPATSTTAASTWPMRPPGTGRRG